MVALVLLAVFIAGAFIFTGISRQSDRRRYRNYNRNRRGRSRHRDRYEDDDDYYDDRDDDYRRHRRGRRSRRDDYYDDEQDYNGMFISFGILILIGLGIYLFSQSNHSNELTKSKIVMTRDYTIPNVTQNDEQQLQVDDSYPINNNFQNEDFDEDVGSVEEGIPEEYDEKDSSVEVPQEVVPGNFYAQVHAFGSLDNATLAKEDWIAKGHSAKVVYFKNGDGLYHVLIGGYPSKRAAKSFIGRSYEQIYQLVEGQYYDLK